MKYYIANGAFYEVPSVVHSLSASDNELYHYGVKGMKWGKRKQYAPVGNVGRRSSRQAERNSPEAQARRAERVAKAKKAAKIGAAVAGTALAAYGTYKLAKFVQGKRNTAAFQKAQDYIDKNVYRKWGDTKFADGTRMMDFRDGMGNEITTRGARNTVGKAVGRHNAQVVAKGRQMYRDATNTKLDRGLAKVVNTGDTVGNAAKRAATSAGNAAKSAGNAVKTSANKAKNAVLDVVNPIYEYTPGSTSSRTRNINGVKLTESVTKYYKSKKKRT